MGGPQSYPFVLFPTELAYPEEPVVGAETIHRVLRGWLAQLGQDAYAPAGLPGAPAPGPPPAISAPGSA